ncbi:hypothetical protein ACTWPB_12550 [Nocardia sp. IBHARD005]|uniref:hypothetical protein n=1 Tax=Nocardia sp. IBHARD005 TaxID=3457765 RepID=UPI0040597D78
MTHTDGTYLREKNTDGSYAYKKVGGTNPANHPSAGKPAAKVAKHDDGKYWVSDKTSDGKTHYQEVAVGKNTVIGKQDSKRQTGFQGKSGTAETVDSRKMDVINSGGRVSTKNGKSTMADTGGGTMTCGSKGCNGRSGDGKGTFATDNKGNASAGTHGSRAFTKKNPNAQVEYQDNGGATDRPGSRGDQAGGRASRTGSRDDLGSGTAKESSAVRQAQSNYKTAFRQTTSEVAAKAAANERETTNGTSSSAAATNAPSQGGGGADIEPQSGARANTLRFHHDGAYVQSDNDPGGRKGLSDKERYTYKKVGDGPGEATVEMHADKKTWARNITPNGNVAYREISNAGDLPIRSEDWNTQTGFGDTAGQRAINVLGSGGTVTNKDGKTRMVDADGGKMTCSAAGCEGSSSDGQGTYATAGPDSTTKAGIHGGSRAFTQDTPDAPIRYERDAAVEPDLADQLQPLFDRRGVPTRDGRLDRVQQAVNNYNKSEAAGASGTAIVTGRSVDQNGNARRHTGIEGVAAAAYQKSNRTEADSRALNRVNVEDLPGAAGSRRGQEGDPYSGKTKLAIDDTSTRSNETGDDRIDGLGQPTHIANGTTPGVKHLNYGDTGNGDGTRQVTYRNGLALYASDASGAFTRGKAESDSTGLPDGNVPVRMQGVFTPDRPNEILAERVRDEVIGNPRVSGTVFETRNDGAGYQIDSLGDETRPAGSPPSRLTFNQNNGSWTVDRAPATGTAQWHSAPNAEGKRDTRRVDDFSHVVEQKAGGQAQSLQLDSSYDKRQRSVFFNTSGDLVGIDYRGRRTVLTGDPTGSTADPEFRSASCLIGGRACTAENLPTDINRRDATLRYLAREGRLTGRDGRKYGENEAVEAANSGRTVEWMVDRGDGFEKTLTADPDGGLTSMFIYQPRLIAGEDRHDDTRAAERVGLTTHLGPDGSLRHFTKPPRTYQTGATAGLSTLTSIDTGFDGVVTTQTVGADKNDYYVWATDRNGRLIRGSDQHGKPLSGPDGKPVSAVMPIRRQVPALLRGLDQGAADLPIMKDVQQLGPNAPQTLPPVRKIRPRDGWSSAAYLYKGTSDYYNPWATYEFQDLGTYQHPERGEVRVGITSTGDVIYIGIARPDVRLNNGTYDQVYAPLRGPGQHVMLLGRDSETNEEIMIAVAKSQHQMNVDDMQKQWGDIGRSGSFVRGVGQTGQALAASVAVGIDAATFAQTNTYGTGKECLGAGEKCGEFAKQAAIAATAVTPVGKIAGVVARPAVSMLASRTPAAVTKATEVVGSKLAKTTPFVAPFGAAFTAANVLPPARAFFYEHNVTNAADLVQRVKNDGGITPGTAARAALLGFDLAAARGLGNSYQTVPSCVGPGDCSPLVAADVLGLPLAAAELAMIKKASAAATRAAQGASAADAAPRGAGSRTGISPRPAAGESITLHRFPDGTVRSAPRDFSRLRAEVGPPVVPPRRSASGNPAEPPVQPFTRQHNPAEHVAPDVRPVAGRPAEAASIGPASWPRPVAGVDAAGARPGPGASVVIGARPGPGTSVGAGNRPGPGADAGPGARPGPGADAGPGARPGPGADAGAGARVGADAGDRAGAPRSAEQAPVAGDGSVAGSPQPPKVAGGAVDGAGPGSPRALDPKGEARTESGVRPVAEAGNAARADARPTAGENGVSRNTARTESAKNTPRAPIVRSEAMASSGGRGPQLGQQRSGAAGYDTPPQAPERPVQPAPGRGLPPAQAPAPAVVRDGAERNGSRRSGRAGGDAYQGITHADALALMAGRMADPTRMTIDEAVAILHAVQKNLPTSPRIAPGTAVNSVASGAARAANSLAVRVADAVKDLWAVRSLLRHYGIGLTDIFRAYGSRLIAGVVRTEVGSIVRGRGPHDQPTLLSVAGTLARDHGVRAGLDVLMRNPDAVAAARTLFTDQDLIRDLLSHYRSSNLAPIVRLLDEPGLIAVFLARVGTDPAYAAVLGSRKFVDALGRYTSGERTMAVLRDIIGMPKARMLTIAATRNPDRLFREVDQAAAWAAGDVDRAVRLLDNIRPLVGALDPTLVPAALVGLAANREHLAALASAYARNRSLLGEWATQIADHPKMVDQVIKLLRGTERSPGIEADLAKILNHEGLTNRLVKLVTGKGAPQFLTELLGNPELAARVLDRRSGVLRRAVAALAADPALPASALALGNFALAPVPSWAAGIGGRVLGLTGRATAGPALTVVDAAEAAGKVVKSGTDRVRFGVGRVRSGGARIASTVGRAPGVGRFVPSSSAPPTWPGSDQAAPVAQNPAPPGAPQKRATPGQGTPADGMTMSAVHLDDQAIEYATEVMATVLRAGKPRIPAWAIRDFMANQPTRPQFRPSAELMQTSPELARNLEIPGWFPRHYFLRKNGTEVVRRKKSTHPQLRLDAAGNLTLASNLPEPIKPRYLGGALKVGRDSGTPEALAELDAAARKRHRAIQGSLAAARRLAAADTAAKIADTPANRIAAAKAEAEYKSAHTKMGTAAEEFGESAAALHAVPMHYPGAKRLELGGPANGNNQFDQVWRTPDGRYIVVEAKSSTETELGVRKLSDGSGRRVTQGTPEYFDEILRLMSGRGEAALAGELADAVRTSRLDYILVKGNINTGDYAGFTMHKFDTAPEG